MQSATARAAIIVAVRERVNSTVAGRLNDREAIQVALAAALRDPEDVIGFLLPGHLARLANNSRDKFKMDHLEWNALFGNGAQAVRDGGMARIVASAEFEPQLARLSNTLKMTIGEKDQAVVWARTWSKVLCYVAMHLDVADEALLGVLGTIIKADNRRIEELHNSIDDDEAEVLLISKCIVALSECIV